MLRLLSFWIFIVAGLPAQQAGLRVYDQAFILSAETQSEIQSLSQIVERETTAEFAVVTVRSLEGESVEQYANNLFRSWGIGKREVNNGVLFLIAPTERRARIEVGYGLEPLLTDGQCGEILDTIILPQFRNGKMSDGVLNGTREIARILRANPEASRGVPGSAPRWIRSSYKDAKFASLALLVVACVLVGWCIYQRRRGSYSSTAFLFTIVGFSAFAAVVVWILLKSPALHAVLPYSIPGGIAGLVAIGSNFFGYWRYGPHNCKRCGARLVLIGEKEDDAKLTEVQRLEEQIGSVDYDVWYCQACLTSDVARYVSAFSRFTDCPKCTHRTLNRDTTVDTPATTLSTGIRRVMLNCVSCKFNDVQFEVIPRISRSSSSSGSSGGGSSFGGGSSGGGGASGSW